jgi:hypothetical protein
MDDLLDPTRVLGRLRWEPIGRGEVAGRSTITALARPRPLQRRGGPDGFALHRLGLGAEEYRIEVDAERGILLEVVALRDGTFAFLMSETIPLDRLAELAAGLKPASDARAL